MPWMPKAVMRALSQTTSLRRLQLSRLSQRELVQLTNCVGAERRRPIARAPQRPSPLSQEPLPPSEEPSRNSPTETTLQARGGGREERRDLDLQHLYWTTQTNRSLGKQKEAAPGQNSAKSREKKKLISQRRWSAADCPRAPSCSVRSASPVPGEQSEQ